MYHRGMDISTRLEEAMRDAGFASQSALARASGVPQPTINRIARGAGSKGPEAHTLLLLAEACQVNFQWLHQGSGPKRSASPAALHAQLKNVLVCDDSLDDPRFVAIPMVTLRLSAGVTGFQTEPDTRDGGSILVSAGWVTQCHYSPAHLVAIQVRGQSMEPSLYEDDILIVNTADTKPMDGQVYAVNYEGEAVVKRLSRDAGMWWLESDNPDKRKYHRKLCQGEACLIVGRVVRKDSQHI
jgi:phage repressor protein C with HTH and peptisase S24 domain